MKITCELQRKVDSIYRIKINDLNQKIEDVRKEKQAQIKEEISKSLEENNSSLVSLLADYINTIRSFSRTGDLSDTIAWYVINRDEAKKEFEESVKEYRNEIQKCYDEKDNLLISISYSKDLDSIKKIFTDFGLTF